LCGPSPLKESFLYLPAHGHSLPRIQWEWKDVPDTERRHGNKSEHLITWLMDEALESDDRSRHEDKPGQRQVLLHQNRINGRTKGYDQYDHPGDSRRYGELTRGPGLWA